MRKNGSRQISVKQYRFTDLFLFAVIMVLGELLPHFALVWFPNAAMYTVSFVVPITVLVMIRWGWPAVFYPLISGLMYCILNGGSGTQYAVYCIGNLFAALMLIPRYLIGVRKITSRWWTSALFAIGMWVCVYLGKSSVSAVCMAIAPVEGSNPADGFIGFAVYDAMSLALALLIIIVIRRFKGMLEDQKVYLNNIDAERKEKMRRDGFGDELQEIDEESLEILNKQNDLYD